ncbi:hypothetical protein MN1_860 [Thermus phage MN1]|nr:hypothetical protein MN1_860 [Thermus phage MN1]
MGREDYALYAAYMALPKGPKEALKAYRAALVSGPPEGVDPDEVAANAARLRAMFGADPLTGMLGAYEHARRRAAVGVGRGVHPLSPHEAQRTYSAYLEERDGDFR